MRGFVFFLIVLLFLVACTSKEVQKPVVEPVKENIEKEADTMKITSNDFQEGGMIPSKFTCQGEDINPHLTWDEIPEGVKSLALIVDDPDAPMGTWVHWLVKDIPPSVTEIPQNSIPGNQVTNDFGKEDYGGPCPPSGVHRYFFRLFALDVANLDADNKEDFYKQAEKHAIAKAELMGKYTKS